MKRLALAIALVAIVGACKKADQQPASQPAAMDTSKTMMADTAKMAPAPTKAAPTPTKMAPAPTKMAPARTKTKRP